MHRSRYGKIAPAAESASDPKLMLREDLSKEYYAILDVVSSYDRSLLIVKGWSVTLSLTLLGLGFHQKHYALFALAALSGAAFWYLDGLMKGFQYRYYIRMREIEYTAYRINRVILGGDYGDSEISTPRIDMMWGFVGYLLDEDHQPLRPPESMRRRGLRRITDRRIKAWSAKAKRAKAQTAEAQTAEAAGAEDRGAEGPEEHLDWRADEPWRRRPDKIFGDLWGRFRWANVMLPHVVAVVLGFVLFIAAALNVPGLEQLAL